MSSSAPDDTGSRGATGLLERLRGSTSPGSPDLDASGGADGARPARVRWRVDPVAVVLGLLSLLLSAGFLAVSLHYNQGRLIPPLDDVYIHLQYARQFGSGQAFQYLPGEPYTTGASSLLYVLVLGSAWALGFQGPYLLAFAVGFGALGAASATVLTHLTGARLCSRAVGTWAGSLTLVSGPLLWGSTSGMEVGLVAALIAGTVYAFVREQPRARFVATPIVGALLALARPEGLIVAAALVAGMLWSIGRAAWADRRPPSRALGLAALAVLPVLVGVGQLALYSALTGTSQANGVQAKSWLNQGAVLQPLEVADDTLRNLQELAAALAGLPGQDFVPPMTLFLVIVGLVGLGIASRWRTLAVALGVGLVGMLASVSSLTTARWQDLRYLQPFTPLLLLLAVLGVAALAGVGLAGPRARVAFHGLLTVLLLFGLVAAPTWALRLGQQASNIREGPVSVGNWLRGHLPPGSRVGVHDVGAVAYFSGFPTVDLVGLTTNGMARPVNNGAGTLYEALRHLPPEQRPTHFSFFEEWPRVPPLDLEPALVLGEEPLMSFHLKSPVRPLSATAPQTCETDHSCDRINVWAADWSLAGTGDLPDRPVPGEVRDHLNVADLDDEARHAWTVDTPVSGRQPTSRVDNVVVDGREIVDSGRHVVGGETFTLSNLVPGRPVTITGRIGAREPFEDDDTGGRAADVAVDGRPAGRWDFAVARDTPWDQSTFVVPAELVTGTSITVTTGPRQEFLGPYPDYVSYGYWATQ